MKKTNLIYATSNPGKAVEIGRFLQFFGLVPVAFSDYVFVAPEPEETGITLGDNAMLKARSYAEALAASHKLRGQRAIVLADDTGLFIPALNNEPGIRVRRWAGHKMTDGEIIEYALKRMAHLRDGERNAQFRTVLCMMPVDENGSLGTFTVCQDSLDGRILEVPSPTRIEGFPFESLFYASDYDMLLGDVHRMDGELKMQGKIFNHRERALVKAAPIIADFIRKEVW
jgi:XTP/dITP diphosphohydrolase